jgi:hypothetical protein
MLAKCTHLRSYVGLLAVFLTAVVLTGCAVAFISSYDESTDKGVSALQTSIDSLMRQLDQDPVPDYGAVKKNYDTIRVDLGSLRFRNEARPNNTITVKQLDILKGQLDTLENQHKNRTLNQVMVGPAQEALDRTMSAILKLELAKKELNKGE